MPSLSAVPLRRSVRRAAGSAPGGRQRRQFARGDHLRQHHGGGLQRLDLFLRIGPPRPVLHHQHAERIAGAQDRHAEERVVDFLAGLRPIGEGRMRLRVGQVDGVRLARDEADEAFVGAHHGAVDGFPVEALGGVEFKRAVDPQHVDGAHLRHHVGGDQHHDLVEAFLRADRLRHDFAEPAQQYARTAQRAAHGVWSFGPEFKVGYARGPTHPSGEQRAYRRSAPDLSRLYRKPTPCGKQNAMLRRANSRVCQGRRANAGFGRQVRYKRPR